MIEGAMRSGPLNAGGFGAKDCWPPIGAMPPCGAGPPIGAIPPCEGMG